IPESIRVANCREKIAMSRALIPRKRSKSCSTRNAWFFSETSRTINPRSRSCSVTWPFDSASTSPRDGIPATSTALKAKVATSASVRQRRGGSGIGLGLPDGSEQTPELLRHRRALLGELAGDPARADQLCQMRVHGLHPERAGRLDRRVDLVRLALADQVPDGRRGHEHFAGDDATTPVCGRQQLLGDDSLQADGELHPHLRLLFAREDVD